VSIVQTGHIVDETSVIVVGRVGDITNGFASAVEAEGWRWEETPDLLTLFTRPLPPRAVLAMPVLAFTPTTYAMIRHLTTSPRLPVVVFSAECGPEVINAALRAGADDFLPLPVTIEEMIARLTAVIRVRFGAWDEWVDHRQPPDNLSFLHDARIARKAARRRT
jgi:DNA-binding response OmpR family regulator